MYDVPIVLAADLYPRHPGPTASLRCKLMPKITEEEATFPCGGGRPKEVWFVDERKAITRRKSKRSNCTTRFVGVGYVR
jgi:hypothetical protein